jgi:hypothetical protein
MNKPRLLVPISLYNIKANGLKADLGLKDCSIEYYVHKLLRYQQPAIWQLQFFITVSNPIAFEPIKQIKNNTIGNFRLYSTFYSGYSRSYPMCRLILENENANKVRITHIKLLTYLLSLRYGISPQLIVDSLLNIVYKA